VGDPGNTVLFLIKTIPTRKQRPYLFPHNENWEIYKERFLRGDFP